MKTTILILSGFFAGCHSSTPLTTISPDIKQQCERQALMAQQSARSQVRYESFGDGTSGRSHLAMRSQDEGKWAYDVTLRECLQREQSTSTSIQN